tara:strand:- start:894 stop:1313 length:420 start_codon:yes stop_codon:yes gene_type:complete
MRILIVDENKETKDELTTDLENSKKKFVLFYANDGIEALSLLQEGIDIDLIISDLQLPKMSGISLLETLRKSNSSVQFVLFSSKAPKKLNDISKSLQLSGWFQKSFTERMKLQSKQLIKQLEKFSDQLDALKEFESLKN